jgi:hypothetical protein
MAFYPYQAFATPILAFIFLGSTVTINDAAGGIVIIIGLFICVYAKWRERGEATAAELLKKAKDSDITAPTNSKDHPLLRSQTLNVEIPPGVKIDNNFVSQTPLFATSGNNNGLTNNIDGEALMQKSSFEPNSSISSYITPNFANEDRHPTNFANRSSSPTRTHKSNTYELIT